MSIFPLKDKIPCGNEYFTDGTYAKNSSGYLKKFLQIVQNEAKREDTIDKVFSKTRPTTEAKLEEDIDYIDIQLAEDLKLERKRAFLEQKRRQQLRENTQELKELETKLRAAYISKGLAAQRAEKELLLAKEKEKQNYENELLEKARITYDENERNLEELDKAKKEKLRAELKHQMAMHEHQKALRMQEHVEEKKIVDDIVKRIWNEQYEEQRAKVEKRLKLKEEEDEFRKARQMMKLQGDNKANDETREMDAINREQDERARKMKESKLAQLKEREIISATIGKKLSLEMTEKRNRMEILEDLLIEEKAARDEDLERKENALKLKEKAEHRIGLCNMIENNKRRMEEQAEEDKEYRNVLLNELSKNEQVEKIKEEKKRQKMLEHKTAIREGLDFKVQLRAKELTAICKQRENDIRESQRRQQLIQEERIRMLQEHAVALQGFFPPGVLKESDREFLSMPPNVK